MDRAIFLDKDGTLLENIPYNVDPRKIQFKSGSMEALSLLFSDGYRLIVVTNQSGIARGLFGEEDVKRVEAALRIGMAKHGITLTGFYYCPHHPCGQVLEYARSCRCRKPKPGLILDAAQDHGIDLANSWVIGDELKDIAAGNTAGCKTIFLADPNSGWILTEVEKPTHVVFDWANATRAIISESLGRVGPTVQPQS